MTELVLYYSNIVGMEGACMFKFGTQFFLILMVQHFFGTQTFTSIQVFYCDLGVYYIDDFATH